MIKRLARCIREYKWAALLSPLCMVGEVSMEARGDIKQRECCYVRLILLIKC